jgi:hypothetical protein
MLDAARAITDEKAILFLRETLEDEKLATTISNLKRASFNFDSVLDKNLDLQDMLVSRVNKISELAFYHGNRDALFDFHRALYEILSLRIFQTGSIHEFSFHLFKIERIMADAWLDHELKNLDLANVPLDVENFNEWFLWKTQSHPAFNHLLFDYLAESTDMEGFRYFVLQESSVDTRFDDLIALAQVGASGIQKLELGSNYWDELGNGDPTRVHTTMFSTLMSYLNINEIKESNLTWESLACGNLMIMLSLYRQYYNRCTGCLGITELLVPPRFEKVIAAAQRLNIPHSIMIYHLEHATVDHGHAMGWLKNVIGPIIKGNPAAALEVAEGALLRLQTSKVYCDFLLSSITGRA